MKSTIVQYSSLSSVQFDGFCGIGIQSVEYSLDDGVQWQGLSTNSISSSETCSTTKSFSVTLNLSANPANVWSGTPAGAFHVQFRGRMANGFTGVNNVILRKFVPSKMILANSSAKQEVSGYKVTSRLVSTSSTQEIGGVYKVKLRVSQ